MNTKKAIVKPGYGLDKYRNQKPYDIQEEFVSTIAKWIKERELKAIKKLLRELITKESVEWWLENWKKCPKMLELFSARIELRYYGLMKPLKNKAILYRNNKAVKEIEY